jgi:glycolate oxidase FAD binding subunit
MENPVSAELELTSDQALAAIGNLVGKDFLRAATAADSTDGVVPRWVVEPASAIQVAQTLKLCDQAQLHVVARGNGTKLDWANPPRKADLILSTRRLNQVLEHAAGDMTATVQAGCTVAAMANILAQRGQRLALDLLWPDRATVGGIIATDDCGPMRSAYGTIRDHLIGITVALPDGALARSGGKVVKNVAGYDLPKLFTGSFGTLGVITQAIFRLYPLPKSSHTVRWMAPTTESLGRLIAALADCSPVTTSVQFEADSAASAPIHVSVLLEGLPAAMEAKLQRVLRAASDCRAQQTEPPADAWTARQRQFSAADSCVAQISLLPTNWPAFIDRMRDIAAAGGFNCNLVAQAVGVGIIRVPGDDHERSAAGIKSLRADVQKLGGSLVILRCIPDIKRRIDVWPDVGSALPLMKRIKTQFDPRGTLSPGRFVGGI